MRGCDSDRKQEQQIHTAAKLCVWLNSSESKDTATPGSQFEYACQGRSGSLTWGMSLSVASLWGTQGCDAHVESSHSCIFVFVCIGVLCTCFHSSVCVNEYLLMKYKIHVLARLDVFYTRVIRQLQLLSLCLSSIWQTAAVLSLLVYLDLRAKKTESRIHPPREEIIHSARGGTDAYQETSGSPHTSSEGK